MLWEVGQGEAEGHVSGNITTVAVQKSKVVKGAPRCGVLVHPCQCINHSATRSSGWHRRSAASSSRGPRQSSGQAPRRSDEKIPSKVFKLEKFNLNFKFKLKFFNLELAQERHLFVTWRTMPPLIGLTKRASSPPL